MKYFKKLHPTLRNDADNGLCHTPFSFSMLYYVHTKSKLSPHTKEKNSSACCIFNMLWLYHRSITLLNLLYASNLWIFVNVNTSTWYWNAKRYTSTLLYVWFSLNWRNAFIKIIHFRVLCIVSFFIIEAFPNTPNLNVAKSQLTFC